MTLDQSDRRTIDELLARYELEPSLHDVYVEGPSDRAILDLALRRFSHRHQVRAYEIDTVHVPAALLAARSLTAGNKARILALADELSRRATMDLRGNAVCLVDLDLDGILRRHRDYRLLLYTSGLSLDLVLATPAVVDKLLSMVLLGFPLSAEELLSEMLPILNERLLQRVAGEILNIRVEPPPINRLCRFDGRALEFRGDEFLKRYLNKAKCADLQGRFREIIETYRPELVRAPRSYVHIEDFLELLHFCARNVKPKLIPEPTHFRRFLFGLLDSEMVSRLPEVGEVAKRFETHCEAV